MVRRALMSDLVGGGVVGWEEVKTEMAVLRLEDVSLQ